MMLHCVKIIAEANKEILNQSTIVNQLSMLTLTTDNSSQLVALERNLVLRTLARPVQ